MNPNRTEAVSPKGTTPRHTPGAWGTQGRYGNFMTEIGNGSKAVATVWTHDDESTVVEGRRVRAEKVDPEGLANAYLIAAAPDLLAAAEAVMARLGTPAPRFTNIDEDDLTAIRALRTAIAKAKGDGR